MKLELPGLMAKLKLQEHGRVCWRLRTHHHPFLFCEEAQGSNNLGPEASRLLQYSKERRRFHVIANTPAKEARFRIWTRILPKPFIGEAQD
ncbi:hypothetical protein Pyn_26510 [Prunus yedoensis var. nudiflora]|uniref:Uncharacterized protein n=1 Tax=Prunus yedoensis var. nudiflora TaxID=2094558 RepID=A0A314XW75_PRUYE|nr:hypothetical protein Pyn_26510 [Prunus yedoensis var. nudiflora]